MGRKPGRPVGAGHGVCPAIVCRTAVLLKPCPCIPCSSRAGMFDRYNEALIQASYGALSLSADVAVLPEIYLPYEANVEDNFTYYEAPAVEVHTPAAVGRLPGWQAALRLHAAGCSPPSRAAGQPLCFPMTAGPGRRR